MMIIMQIVIFLIYHNYDYNGNQDDHNDDPVDYKYMMMIIFVAGWLGKKRMKIYEVAKETK